MDKQITKKANEITMAPEHIEKTSFSAYLSQEDMQYSGAKEKHFDPRSLYDERTSQMKDTAKLGKKTFKAKTEKQRQNNERIDEAKKLTNQATAYTLEIHRSIGELNESSNIDSEGYSKVLYLKNYPFSPRMFLTSKIRSNFKEYVQLVRIYDEILDTNYRNMYNPQDISDLKVLMEPFKKRMEVYCEQNRVTLDGKILDSKAKAKELSREDADNWYDAVTQYKEKKNEYNPDAVDIPSETLNKLLSDETVPALSPVDADVLETNDRIEHIHDLRQMYENAKSAYENASDDDRNALMPALVYARSNFLLATREADFALAKSKGAEKEELDRLRELAKEAHGDLMRLRERRAKQEFEKDTSGKRIGNVTITREQAISTQSDIESFKSRDKLSELNRNIALNPELSELHTAISSYLSGTRYAVGYTEERNRLKQVISILKKTNSPLPELDAIRNYFNEMTNGTLDVTKEFGRSITLKDTAPKEGGNLPRGSTRNAIITGLSYWSDQKDTPLFSHEPTVNDIKQHLVSNCWMVASVAGLVHTDPKLLKQCIKDNGDGTVTVRLYETISSSQLEKEKKEKEPPSEDDFSLDDFEELTEEKGTSDDLGFGDELDDEFADLIDDDFNETYVSRAVYVTVTKETPCIAGSDTLSEGALWMQMIEKAAAHLGRDKKTGYKSLWYGQGGNFLKTLLGIDPDAVSTEDPDALFEELSTATERRCVYNTGTSGNVGSSDGLNAGHAYTIMGAKEIDGKKYVLLRNPYSTHSLHYEEDGSKTRTGTLLTTKSDESYGQFYMEINEFVQKFGSVTKTDLNKLNNPPSAQ